MPLTHRDNGVSMGGSLKEVSILKNCYILADPNSRINLYAKVGPYIQPMAYENFFLCFFVFVICRFCTRKRSFVFLGGKTRCSFECANGKTKGQSISA